MLNGWAEVRNLLVMRLDNIGDVVMTGPALRAIKENLPEVRLTLMASPGGAQAAPLLTWIDEVLSWRVLWQDLGRLDFDPEREWDLARRVRERRFDAAIIFTSFCVGAMAPLQKPDVLEWEEPKRRLLMHKRTPSAQPPLFKWRHFQAELIVLAVRWGSLGQRPWYLYPLSYRQVEELLSERGLDVEHTTIYRWVQTYAPELDKQCRAHLRPTNDSWGALSQRPSKVDETSIKVKGRGCYFYRSVDSEGQTLDFC